MRALCRWARSNRGVVLDVIVAVVVSASILDTVVSSSVPSSLGSSVCKAIGFAAALLYLVVILLGPSMDGEEV